MRTGFLYFFLVVCLYGVYLCGLWSITVTSYLIEVSWADIRYFFTLSGFTGGIMTLFFILLAYGSFLATIYLVVFIIKTLRKRYRERKVPVDEGDQFY